MFNVQNANVSVNGYFISRAFGAGSLDKTTGEGFGAKGFGAKGFGAKGFGAGGMKASGMKASGMKAGGMKARGMRAGNIEQKRYIPESFFSL